jgi:hypothetical protein
MEERRDLHFLSHPCTLPPSSAASHGPFSPGVQVLLPGLRPEPPCGTRGCQARGRSAWAAAAHSVDVLRREQRAAVDRRLRAEDEALASVWAAAGASPPPRSSDCATSAWAATVATGRNCSGRQLGAGGRSHGGLQALAGLQAHCGTDGKGYGVTAYGRVVSLADWEPSGKGDGIGGCVFFVSTADEVR